MYIIGANPYQGLFTTEQFQRGKPGTASPGTRAAVTDPSTGQTKEFVSVKLGAATWISGTLIVLDGLSASGVGAVSVTATGAPAAAINARAGVLVFGSATATQTMAGTAYGWAQIYGEALAWVSASVTTPGQALAAGANGQLLAAVVQVSASAQTNGITAIVTNTASTTAALLINVFLNYPAFSGPPDANLS
jgi:hypothetical protein